MGKIKISVLLVVLFICACTSQKMTKLETELDKIISQYDVKYWRADTLQHLDSEDAEILEGLLDDRENSNRNFKTSNNVFVNDTLIEKLDDFCKKFFANVENYNDLVFQRYRDIYSDYPDNPERYIIDTLQITGKYSFHSLLTIKNAPSYEKLKIKKGVVCKLLGWGENSDMYADCHLYKDSMYIQFFFTLELTDAEFEQVK